MDLSPEELKKLVAEGVEKALDGKFSKFFVPPEAHYMDHHTLQQLFIDPEGDKIKKYEERMSFIDSIIKLSKSTKSKIGTSLAMMAIIFAVGLVSLGFFHYLKDGLQAVGMVFGSVLRIRDK